MQRVFRVVETKELQPVGLKPTSALIRSVRRFGVLNPLLLAEVVDENGVIGLGIVDGNRRIRAAKSARLPKVPAVVLKETTAQDRARLTLMCNYMRSANFHTESTAILALATNEDAAADVARTIGLGPAKVRQLYRKIETMPEPVRQAMHDYRLPVSAATWVGAWPAGLQQELIELLSRRRYVTSTMMKELREWYAERHPEEFAATTPARVEVPFDEWRSSDVKGIPISATVVPDVAHLAARSDPEAVAPDPPSPPVDRPAESTPGTIPASVIRGDVARHIPVGADCSQEPDRDSEGSDRLNGEQPSTPRSAVSPRASGDSAFASLQSSPVVNTTWTAPQPAVRPSPVDTVAPSADSLAVTIGRVAVPEPVPVTNSTSARPAPDDDCVERRIAYVVRLDATLDRLAREGRELGIDRAVWVDRAMRAWDRAGL